MNSKQLVGTYKLVTWENQYLTGEVTYPLGQDAQGVIRYSADGYVFVHIMAKGRKQHKAGDVFGGLPAEIKNSTSSHISYYGTYEVEGHEVVHTVSISSFPNWVETEQRREIAFKDGLLLLSAHGLQVERQKVSAQLVWQRI